MRREFLPLVLTNVGLLSGALLATCHSLFIESQNPIYEQLAIHYKVACLGHLNNAIPCETDFIEDATLIQALLLASNDVSRCQNSCAWAPLIILSTPLATGLLRSFTMTQHCR